MGQQASTNGTKVVHVHQLKLKRTIFEVDAKMIRLYMSEDMYLKLSLNALYSQMTVDEYVREVLTAHLKDT